MKRNLFAWVLVTVFSLIVPAYAIQDELCVPESVCEKYRIDGSEILILAKMALSSQGQEVESLSITIDKKAIGVSREALMAVRLPVRAVFRLKKIIHGGENAPRLILTSEIARVESEGVHVRVEAGYLEIEIWADHAITHVIYRSEDQLIRRRL